VDGGPVRFCFEGREVEDFRARYINVSAIRRSAF
jgi:hypothetical protein